MSSHADAEDFMSALNPRMRSLAHLVHSVFLGEGCSSYVKTIYIGYEIDGEMVAALYSHAKHLEIAIALAEDHDSELLVDASHLTWRTLPVAAILSTQRDVRRLVPLARDAATRVRTSTHEVMRDNEFFTKSRRRV